MKDQTSTLLELLDASGGSLHALLTRLTLREDVAEDLMQELFIKLSNSNGLDRASQPVGYAYRSAINLGVCPSKVFSTKISLLFLFSLLPFDENGMNGFVSHAFFVKFTC